MKILILNCGSSSLKYQFFDMEQENVLAKGLVERIGLAGAKLNHQVGDSKVSVETEIPDHEQAIQLVVGALTSPEHGVIKDMSAIDAVGHRVVHGGEKFAGSIFIDDAVMKALTECIELAPLHNPPNIVGIKACQRLMPDVPQVGVFDTAFHLTMPPKAYIYGLPYELYKKYGVRRYGFHGTSHRYVAGRTAEILGKPLKDLKLITCHLGNGSSITAIDGGRSVDTTMGFTPLEGVPMGTRCGSIDPAIVTFVMNKENLDENGINELLNKKSGVLGISGLSSDFRDLEEAAVQGNNQAALALEVFAESVKKWVGAYAAVLNGVDAVIFTGGIGENAIDMRARICSGLTYLGLYLDPVKNNVRGKETIISTPDSKVAGLVVPTNEELMIARDTRDIVQALRKTLTNK